MGNNKYAEYTDFILDKTVELLNIDSPTGYTDEAAAWVKKEFEDLGYEANLTKKGGVLVNLTGTDENNGLFLESHTDTLGGMVSSIKSTGRLSITPLGGMNANNAETENVRIVTKFNGEYEGTFQLENASIHVNGEYDDVKRSFETCEVVLDEDVKSKDVTSSIVCPEYHALQCVKPPANARFNWWYSSAPVIVSARIRSR